MSTINVNTYGRLAAAGFALSLFAITGFMPTGAMADTISLTCRGTGGWANRGYLTFLKIDEDNSVFYHVMSDGSGEGEDVTVVDGKVVANPKKFDKNSDIIQWGEPNGDTTNFWSFDRVSGDVTNDGPSGVGSGRSTISYHCEKTGTDRKY